MSCFLPSSARNLAIPDEIAYGPGRGTEKRCGLPDVEQAGLNCGWFGRSCALRLDGRYCRCWFKQMFLVT